MRSLLLGCCLAGLLACGCSGLIKAVSTVNVDATQGMRTTADALKGVTPKPRWHTPVSAPDPIELHRLGEGTVLVGLELADMLANRPGVYKAVDVATGATRWEYDAAGSDWPSVSAYPSDGVVVFQRSGADGSEYVVVDAANGAELWDIAQEEAHVFAIDHDHDQLLRTSAEEGGFALVANRLRDGHEVWSTPLSMTPSQLSLAPDHILVIGDGIVAVDPATGAAQWKADLPAVVAKRSAPVVAPSGLLVPMDNGAVSMFSMDGRLVWSVAFEGANPMTVLATEDLVLVEYRHRLEFELVAYAPADGAELWRHKMPTYLWSALGRHEGRLSYATKERVVLLDATNGTMTCSWETPTGATLPSHVRVDDQRTLVAAETWVGVFPHDCSAPPWLHEVSRVSTWAWASKLHKGSVKANAKAQGLSDDQAESFLQQTETSQQDTKPLFLSQHEAYMARSSARLADATTTAGERQLIHSQRGTQTSIAASGLEADIALQRGMAVVNFQFSTINFMLSAGDMIRAAKAAARLEAGIAAVKRAKDKVTVTYRAHFGALQGKWYVRPFHWEDGIGLLLVDTTTGSWREIVTSPSEPNEISVAFLNLPLGLVAQESEILISVGVGVHTENWEVWDDYVAGTTIRRSVLAFDLASIKWRKPGSYKTKSFAAIARSAK